jgi:hypothetical protein
MPDVTEIEARRAERKAATQKAREEQYAKDIEAIDALEIESGEDLETLKVNSFKPGLPTLVGVKAPTADYYKRFAQMIRKAGQNLEARAHAQDLLAESCWKYPTDPETRKAMKEAFPGVLVSIAVKAAELAELNSEAEGKS